MKKTKSLPTNLNMLPDATSDILKAVKEHTRLLKHMAKEQLQQSIILREMFDEMVMKWEK